MQRRHFIGAVLGMGLVEMQAAAAAKRSVIELRYMRLRNTTENQMQRTSEFLKNTAVPALKRAGVAPLGFFASVIAEESPFILALATFPSIAAMELARDKQSADEE